MEAHVTTPHSKGTGEAGFSIVEMLIAAFILAIGLLGLAMLETMAWRANTGSRSRNTAILIAEGLLDDAQTQGRAAHLWSQQGSTPPDDLLGLFKAATHFQCNYEGRRLPDAANNTSYFDVKVQPTVVVGSVAQVGGLVDMAVTVTWTEGVDAKGTPHPRTVAMKRRISYAIS